MASKTIITALAVMLLALGIPSFFRINEVQSANLQQQPGQFQMELPNQYTENRNSTFPYQYGYQYRNNGSDSLTIPALNGGSSYGYGQMGGMMGGTGRGQFGRGFTPMGGSFGNGMMGF